MAKNRQRASDWYYANQERGIANATKSQQANASTRRIYLRKYRAENKTHIQALLAAWCKANPDKKRAYALVYAWRTKHARGYASAEQITARVAYYGNLCAYCGGQYEHLDHVIPISRGGTNWPANLRPACSFCNLSKHDKTLGEFLAVSSHEHAYT